MDNRVFTQQTQTLEQRVSALEKKVQALEARLGSPLTGAQAIPDTDQIKADLVGKGISVPNREFPGVEDYFHFKSLSSFDLMEIIEKKQTPLVIEYKVGMMLVRTYCAVVSIIYKNTNGQWLLSDVTIDKKGIPQYAGNDAQGKARFGYTPGWSTASSPCWESPIAPKVVPGAEDELSKLESELTTKSLWFVNGKYDSMTMEDQNRFAREMKQLRKRISDLKEKKH
jgi:BMFP domain-containing protein YqiC